MTMKAKPDLLESFHASSPSRASHNRARAACTEMSALLRESHPAMSKSLAMAGAMASFAGNAMGVHAQLVGDLDRVGTVEAPK